jgi:hypothetical protein
MTSKTPNNSPFSFSSHGQNFESVLNDPRNITEDWWFLKFFDTTYSTTPIHTVIPPEPSKDFYKDYITKIEGVFFQIYSF